MRGQHFGDADAQRVERVGVEFVASAIVISSRRLFALRGHCGEYPRSQDSTRSFDWRLLKSVIRKQLR